MNEIGRYLVRTFHHKRLSDSTGAIAGLATGVSFVVGMVASHYAPHGVHRLAAALHFARQPLIARIAPLIGGIAAALVTAAGIVRFYSWCKEREEEAQ